MKVLSLFDGLGTGKIALERAGISVDKYYASEIEEKSIEIARKNYPDIIHLGDVKSLSFEELDKLGDIDLLIGGSPCRNLSKSIVDKEHVERGLKGDSYLFFEYIRIFEYIKPKYFLFENVESMKDNDKDIITKFLGVEPIMIDSALVSAQERKRYYWTNIKGVTQPQDKGLVIKDIMQTEGVPEKLFYDIPYEFYGWDKRIIARLQLWNYDMLQRVYNPNFKAPTLTACRGGHKQKKIYDNGRCRRMTPLEYERLQTIPDNFTSGVADKHRYNMLGDGWTCSVISHIFSFLPLTDDRNNDIIDT